MIWQPKLVLIFGVMLCCAASSPKPERIALVIGNSRYEHATPLPNAVRDAERLIERLKYLGFEVMTPSTNLDREGLGLAIINLRKRINDSLSDPIVFFYYAGHAAQDEFGTNYLIPTNTGLGSPEEVRLTGVELKPLLNEMADAGNSINIVVIDACRDWFEGARVPGYPRGLSDMGVLSSVLIAYATRTGQTADEGASSTTSPYSRRLIEALDRYHSAPVSLLFNDITNRVFSDTEGRQAPEYVNGLTKNGRWSFDNTDFVAVPETPRVSIFNGQLSEFLENLDRERLLDFSRRKTSFVDALLDRRDILEKYHINTEARLSYFLAIVAYESAGFVQIQEELFGYSAERLRSTFSSRVKTDEDAQKLAQAGPEEIANTVYGSRLGNGPPESGDGWKYRGRGMFFLTGRENYRSYGKMIGVDLEEAPDLVNDNEINIAISAAVWHRLGMNEAADLDDMKLAVRRMNGTSAAYNNDHLNSRLQWLRAARKAVSGD